MKDEVRVRETFPWAWPDLVKDRERRMIRWAQVIIVISTFVALVIGFTLGKLL